MDLKRLKSFVAVAERGTVSAAAQLLRITQPALSRQIGALEEEIGFKLFARAGRRLVLTARGEQLLGDCRNLLAHAGTVSERAQSLRRGDLRVLRIAASALTIEGAFPEFLHEYSKHHPDVQLTLIEADASEHFGMLERGDAQLSINVVNMIQIDEDRFGSYLLPKFQIQAICAPSLSVSETDEVEIRTLSRYPLLLPSRNYATRQLFDAAWQLTGGRPDIFVESGAAHALIALAAAGHGVAIIPSILRPDESRLRVMGVTHRGEPLHIALAVLWDKRRTLPRYAETFSALLAQHVRRQFPLPPSSRRRTTGQDVLRRPARPATEPEAGLRTQSARRRTPHTADAGSPSTRRRGVTPPGAM